MWIIRLNRADWISLAALGFSLTGVLLAMHAMLAFSLASILMAMIADAYDGYVARKCGYHRAFGRYLDGSIDVVTYLAGPMIWWVQWGLTDWWALTVLYVMVGAGVVRLSFFNEGGVAKGADGRMHYVGMPVLWIPFILFFFFVASMWISRAVLNPLCVVSLALFSVLMVMRKNQYKPGMGIVWVLLGMIGIALGMARHGY